MPYSDKPLVETTISAAIGSTHDPRFPPLAKEEMDGITVELSVLTEPQIIEVQDPQERLEKVEAGKDGLILRYRDRGSGAVVTEGLFLPQVWEQLPDKETFLGNLCYKANISNPDAWKEPNTELLRFRVQIFEEKEPKGEIVEKPL